MEAPFFDVQTFAQRQLDERWRLVADGLNRLLALEQSVLMADAREARRFEAMEKALQAAEARLQALEGKSDGAQG